MSSAAINFLHCKPQFRNVAFCHRCPVDPPCCVCVCVCCSHQPWSRNHASDVNLSDSGQ